RDKISFTANDSNNDGVAELTGTLTVTGVAGALPQNAFASIRNNATGASGSDTAASDGSFSISVAYTFGDPVTLLLSSVDVEPGSTLRLNFSEPLLSEDFTQDLKLYETNDTSQTISFTTTLLSANQILDVHPTTNLKSNTDYTLELSKLKDFSSNAMPQTFKIRFQTRAFDIIGSASSGQVNDTMLYKDHLLVGKEDGLEIFSTANPFDMGNPMTKITLSGGIRSFARYGD